MPTRAAAALPLMLLLACGGGGGGASPTAATAAAAAKPDSTAIRDSLRHKAAEAGVDTSAAAGITPLVRETYQYVGDSRDPFMPIVQPVNLGPDLADLRLVAILYNQSDPMGSVVTFRDIGNNHRYTFTSRQRVGRISVIGVDSNTVKLREDGLGAAEFQTYSLRRPEDQKP
ncbi:MAG: hypothetical protein ACREL5_04485 [Gemmatimonadales bacterium]